VIQEAPSPPQATSSPSGTGSPLPQAAPSASPAPPAIPTPSLKPGEVITWIRIERPKLELGQVLVGSFVLVGLTIGFAVGLGVVLGHLRSRKTSEPTHGAGGLDLR